MPIPANFTSMPYQNRVRVLTLNAAHGRKDASNQLLVRKAKIRANIHELSKLLARSRADIVALQETDAPSRWSGGFDHTETIATAAGYPWQARANHTRSWLYQYGTAVLSRHPITASVAHRFAPSPPTLRKGFVIGQVALQTQNHTVPSLIDVVSVHLDYFSQRTRRRQISELTAKLATRPHPLVVLGDFNDEWTDPGSSVRVLAEQANLTAYQPGAEHLPTFGSQRLDWILVSPALEFHSYQVMPDIISDHRAVIAEIGFKP